ncbi:peroxisome biogenesis factor 1 [Elysia marginata]|uniref:Peroxisomal ATPase PEX1 n=1 Tax=Elysia marginata TaxID=1093978 RepID=A0AAV4JBV9_9GAST|nr:peroxisome biogenesis factor 1 [Elysia marginata]
MNTITTILKFGSSKHCFLSVVDSYEKKSKPIRTKRNDEVVVYETELSPVQKAYFTVQSMTGDLTSADVVEINSLYGNKLGLKDGDPLLLRKITAPCPKAKRVFVEPVTVDDWEILESNAGRVESVLLDHVRVVWPGQVMPIWIQRSICIFMTIVRLEPTSLCVILENNTEIVVAQKGREPRNPPPPSSLSLPMQQQQQQQQQQQRQKTKSGPVGSYHRPTMVPPQHSLGSPCRNRSQEFLSSSEFENVDTLEPKLGKQKSPSRSPRNSHSRRITPSNFLSRDSFDRAERETTKPMVTRQSSLMESVMRYIFPSFVNDYRGGDGGDSQSDSDAGSAIDYSMQNLPSRSSVLRVQPLEMACTLEECLSAPRSETAKQIQQARSLFDMRGNRRSSTNVSQRAGHSLDHNHKLQQFSQFSSLNHQQCQPEANLPDRCGVSGELFQPSTVYVDAEFTKNERLLHPYLPHLPHNFIARLKRIPSPREKASLAQKSQKKKSIGPKNPLTNKETKETVNSKASNIVSPVDTKVDRDVDQPAADDSDSRDLQSSCYVRVVAIDRKEGLTDESWQEAADKVLSEQPLLHGHVIVPDLLRRQLKLDATSSVWLQTGTVDLVIPRKVCIFPLSSVPKRISKDMIIAAFKHHIKQIASTEHPLVVFQGLFIKFMIFPGTSVEAQITFHGENDMLAPHAVTMLSEMNIESVLVIYDSDLKDDRLGVINPRLAYSQARDIDPQSFPVKLKSLGGIRDLAKQAMQHLLASTGSRPLSRSTFSVRAGISHGLLLITGPRGSGKTSLVKGLCRKLSHLPVLAYILLVDCKTLRGKTVSNIQKAMEAVFDEAAWREPSVIVFDNLDAIVPAPSGPDSEMNGEALYSAKNSQVLQGLLKYEIANNSRVTVIATSQSQATLHPSLVSSRGIHFVQKILDIGTPCKEARVEILKSILQRHSSITVETQHTLNLAAVAAKTEGYVARDLEGLVNRALHQKLSTDHNEKKTLTDEDLEIALCDFKPVSIRNVQLHKAGDLGWCDVGGLDQVKRSLVETLHWPTKYPQLFESCPLRLRSGILLYGAPGTGKTLLAGVVAKECGLNFISVKGPELLSKYIGASEQAVRDLFSRAQSAKPCILFFDEFDSIAPRRGHDSTGVTDRVVNQMLTQLDGVEGLQGVYVLGATSRPDLIDPALLRPGRLDKCIKCDLPSTAERGAILQVLTRKMTLSPDVDLIVIAEMCSHFTGADLKALLYNAQLKAIHEGGNSSGSGGPLDSILNDSGGVRIRGGEMGQCDMRRRASSVLLDQSDHSQSRSQSGSRTPGSKSGSRSDLKSLSRSSSRSGSRPKLRSGSRSGSNSASRPKLKMGFEKQASSTPSRATEEKTRSYPSSPLTASERMEERSMVTSSSLPNGGAESNETLDLSWSQEDFFKPNDVEGSEEKKGKVSFYTSLPGDEASEETGEYQKQKVVSLPGKPPGKKTGLSTKYDDHSTKAEDVVDGFDPLVDKLDLNFIDDEDMVDGLRKEFETNREGILNSSVTSETDLQAKDGPMDAELSQTLLKKKEMSVAKKLGVEIKENSKNIVPDSSQEDLVMSIVDVISSAGNDFNKKQEMVTAKLNRPDINVVTSSPKTSKSEEPRHKYLYECSVEEMDLICAQESPVKAFCSPAVQTQEAKASARSDSGIQRSEVMSVLDADPAETYPPVTKSKRLRGFERNSSHPVSGSDHSSQESNSVFEADLRETGKGYRGHRKSPSIDRPVVVFRSLEAGLAHLSSEDETKYLAMVRDRGG